MTSAHRFVRAASPLLGARVIAFVAVFSMAGCADSSRNSFAESVPALSEGDGFCAHEDCDGDGYVAPLDCDDGSALVGPEAFDFRGDGIDNDCDGHIDNPVESCETIPASAPGTPADFARAADLCPQRSTNSAGSVVDPLIKAEWGAVKGYGAGQRIWISETKPSQVNIVSAFGKNAPRHGRTMFGLSTGPWATRTPRESTPLDEPNFHLDDACSAIPLAEADCASLRRGAPAGGVNVQDWAELRLWIKAPANARALAFDFSFFTTEFNQFWNASLNDAFFVLIDSSIYDGTNVAKDSTGFSIGVNSAFFQVCAKAPGPPGLASDKSAALQNCVGTDGDAARGVLGSLLGTYYDGAASSPYDGTTFSTDGTKKYLYGGATGWLSARFAVEPGEQLTMRILVHDTFDGLKDSAVLVDALRWEPARSEGVSRLR